MQFWYLTFENCVHFPVVISIKIYACQQNNLIKAIDNIIDGDGSGGSGLVHWDLWIFNQRVPGFCATNYN